MLITKNVTKKFGGLTAIDDVSLKIDEGIITVIIGPNGAGKTTFFNVISGVYTPTEGKVYFEGNEIQNLKPYQVNKIGISRTYQIINLFKNMSVLENVMVGMQSRLNSNFFMSLFHTRKERAEEKAALESAYNWLEFVGLQEKMLNPAGSLSYGEQRLLEIVRGLSSNPKLILLDEPAAGMNIQEKIELDVLLQEIVRRGVSILMVEHDMKLVMDVADKIFVLNNGSLLAEGTPKEIQSNPLVIEAYLGGE